MGQKSIQGSKELAKSIKIRRNELNLTIEEAASKAGVGTKTWSRYEAGESIRKDKGRGICKALSWYSLPGKVESDSNGTKDFSDYRSHEAWSPYIADTFGNLAATSFVIGSDILLDNLQEDMEKLSSMPKGSHIGEIDISWIASLLPPQFLMLYDYDFLYVLNYTINRLRMLTSAGHPIIAQSVIEELALYLIVEESRFLMESMELDIDFDNAEDNDRWDTWIFDIFDDMDIIDCLYSGDYLDDYHEYHFKHWLEKQFHIKD